MAWKDCGVEGSLCIFARAAGVEGVVLGRETVNPVICALSVRSMIDDRAVKGRVFVDPEALEPIGVAIHDPGFRQHRQPGPAEAV